MCIALEIYYAFQIDFQIIFWLFVVAIVVVVVVCHKSFTMSPHERRPSSVRKSGPFCK